MIDKIDETDDILRNIRLFKIDKIEDIDEIVKKKSEKIDGKL